MVLIGKTEISPNVILLWLMAIILASCSKDSEALVLSSEKSLLSYSIKEYPTMVFDGFSNNALTTKMDENNALNGLTAVFSVSSKSKLYVNGVEQSSGITVNNFSNMLSYKILAEDGSSSTFTVSIVGPANEAPIANAGKDRAYYLANTSGGATVDVLLDGSGSTDAEGELLNYQWTIDGNIIAVNEVSEIKLALGTYNIQLEVTDNEGLFSKDNVLVEVRQLGLYYPVDTGATDETKNVLNNLAAIAQSEQFAFGQEFPLSFQLNELSFDLSTSDCKDVTGDHPAVFGIDPHYMLYKSAAEKELHINEARAAYNNGSLVTFDFHQKSRTDGEIYYNNLTSDTDKSLMTDIVNDTNGAREWYFSEMDEVLEIINTDLGFTVVFRLFHEMNGNWFWWGTRTDNHSPQLYIEFYQMTVDYIKERTNHVIFSWSPDKVVDQSYYPGNDYVDIVGLDYYTPSNEGLKQALIALTSFAEENNKIAAFTETGQQQYHSTNPDFWTDNILSVVVEGGSDIKIAWVLSWFNAPWDSSQDNLFIPNASSPQEVKDDFIEFKNSDKTLFQADIRTKDIYTSKIDS